MTSAALSRVKRAELISGLGAVILGLGLGALLYPAIAQLDLVLVALGVLMHGWGMLDKHRLETRVESAAWWWSAPLYRICWASLIAVLAAIVSIAILK